MAYVLSTSSQTHFSEFPFTLVATQQYHPSSDICTLGILSWWVTIIKEELKYCVGIYVWLASDEILIPSNLFHLYSNAP